MQEAWQRASDADADVHLEGDELNPHFAYDDEDAHVRHQVWFLDGVTALERAAGSAANGPQNFRAVEAWLGRRIDVGDLGPPRRARMLRSC